MEELEVGEIIRTKDGIIAKITDIVKEYCIDCDEDVFDLYNGPMMEIPWEYIQEYIKKHSKNLIDLIEVGDIIELDGEKYQVIYDESYNKLGILIPDKNYLAVRHTALEYIFQQDKKVTILTHEQYMQNCYKVEEK